jgi:hypothetical protein
MSNDQSLEQQITALGLTAPRITPDQIDALVEQLSFHTYLIPGTTTTLASALNPAGFEVATVSANVSIAAEFSESVGRNNAIAKAKTAARNELWKLEAYRLKQNIYQASKVGLIAGLEIYQHDGVGEDRMFVGDVATGFCVASINASQAIPAGPGPAPVG